MHNLNEHVKYFYVVVAVVVWIFVRSDAGLNSAQCQLNSFSLQTDNIIAFMIVLKNSTHRKKVNMAKLYSSM